MQVIAVRLALSQSPGWLATPPVVTGTYCTTNATLHGAAANNCFGRMEGGFAVQLPSIQCFLHRSGMSRDTAGPFAMSSFPLPFGFPLPPVT